MNPTPTPEQIEAEMSVTRQALNAISREALHYNVSVALATARLEGEAKGRELERAECNAVVQKAWGLNASIDGLDAFAKGRERGLCEAAQIIDESDCPTRYILVAAILALKEKP